MAIDLGTYGQPEPRGDDGLTFPERGYYRTEEERSAYINWLRYNASPGSMAAQMLGADYVGPPNFQEYRQKVIDDYAAWLAANPNAPRAVIGPGNSDAAILAAAKSQAPAKQSRLGRVAARLKRLL